MNFNQRREVYLIDLPSNDAVNGSIQLSILDNTNSGHFYIKCRKIGQGTNYNQYPNKQITIDTTDPSYLSNRFIEYTVKKDSFYFDGVEYSFDYQNKASNNNVVKIGGWRLQQNDFGNGSKFYAVEIYEPNENLFDIIYPALNKDTGDKGVYSFRLNQFFYDYTNTSINNITLGPIVPTVPIV